MESLIQVHDLHFRPMISHEAIQQRIREIGEALRIRYHDKQPLLLGVLNGAFVFAADLIRACDFEMELSFIKLSSYKGLRSTGQVATLIGLETEVMNRHIVIVEDIIDSGKTLHDFLPELEKFHPASIAIAVLLHKPDATEYPLEIDYIGFSIPNRFVVGYGLDYDGLGRNLPDIYELADTSSDLI